MNWRSTAERSWTSAKRCNKRFELIRKSPISITDFRRIVNFRNVLVHGYAHIVPDTVWGIVEKDVPLLDEEIQRLMSVGEGPSS